MPELQTTLYSLLLLHSTLLIAYLFKERRLIFLQLFLAVFSVHMALNLIENWLARDLTSMVTPVLAQFYGPALLLFFMELMYRDFRVSRTHLVHLLPAASAIVLLATIGPGGAVDSVLSAIIIVYLLVALYRVVRFHGEIKDAYSDPWGVRLDWMVLIIVGFLLGGSLDVASRAGFESGSPPSTALQIVALLMILLTLTAMVWKAMTHTAVLNQPRTHGRQVNANDELEPRQTELFKTGIERLFAEQELYLQHRLTVSDVAEQLSMAPKLVSRLINLCFGQNFSDYVNAKRVDHALTLMTDSRQSHRSLLQIAFDAGFNSKTAFHDSFRRKTGTTPAQWRQQNAAQLSNSPQTSGRN